MEIIVRSELPSVTGLTRDKFTNTFSFSNVDALTVGILDPIIEAVRDFYLAEATDALQPLKDLYSTEVSDAAGAWLIKVYDATGKLDGTTPLGAPVRSNAFTWVPRAGVAAGIPGEVAVVATLESFTRATEPVEEPDDGDPDAVPQRPMQRHTGRLFLGPLNTSCLDATVSGVRPHANILDTARLAVAQLSITTFDDAAGARLAVWSRRDADMRTVAFVSTDNSFDTMRSRGGGPTVRERTTVL